MIRRIVILIVLSAAAFALAKSCVRWSYSNSQLESLYDILQRHKAEGHGNSFADFVALAPEVDEALQARLSLWVKSHKPHMSTLSCDPSKLLDRRPPREVDLENFEKARASVDGFFELLDDGPVCLTRMGWTGREKRMNQSLPIQQLTLHSYPQAWIVMHSVSRWLLLNAFLADAPDETLRRFSRLRQVAKPLGDHPGETLVVTIEGSRDSTYMLLALRNQLGAPALDRWLQEPCNIAERLADIVRAERLSKWSRFAQRIVKGDSVGDHYGHGLPFWRRIVKTKWEACTPDQLGQFLEFLLAYELMLRDLSRAAVPLPHSEGIDDLGYPIRCPAQGFSGLSLVNSVIRTRLNHRCVRAGTVLALRAEQEGRAPDSQEEARDWLGSHAYLLEGGTPVDGPLLVSCWNANVFSVHLDSNWKVPSVLRESPNVFEVGVTPSPYVTPERRLHFGHQIFQYHLR